MFELTIIVTMSFPPTHSTFLPSCFVPLSLSTSLEDKREANKPAIATSIVFTPLAPWDKRTTRSECPGPNLMPNEGQAKEIWQSIPAGYEYKWRLVALLLNKIS